MPVDSISNTSTSPADTADSRIPTQSLGQEDFLKLLVAQLTSQDPMNPKKDTEFIGQMAQFSSLEQTRSMAQQVQQLTGSQQWIQAASLLGRAVQVQTGPDSYQQGVVSEIRTSGSEPQLVIGGQVYKLAQVQSLAIAQNPQQ